MWRWSHGVGISYSNKKNNIRRYSGATNNFAQQAIYRSTHVQPTGSDSHQICLPVSPPQAYRNIHSITILFHGTTAHMWKWSHRLMSWIKLSIVREAKHKNRDVRELHCACGKPKRKTNRAHFKTRLPPAARPSNKLMFIHVLPRTTIFSLQNCHIFHITNKLAAKEILRICFPKLLLCTSVFVSMNFYLSVAGFRGFPAHSSFFSLKIKMIAYHRKTYNKYFYMKVQNMF